MTTQLIHAFVWNWIRMTPAVLSSALNADNRPIHARQVISDVLHALVIPAELYMLLRIGPLLAPSASGAGCPPGTVRRRPARAEVQMAPREEPHEVSRSLERRAVATGLDARTTD